MKFQSQKESTKVQKNNFMKIFKKIDSIKSKLRKFDGRLIIKLSFKVIFKIIFSL